MSSLAGQDVPHIETDAFGPGVHVGVVDRQQSSMVNNDSETGHLDFSHSC